MKFIVSSFVAAACFALGAISSLAAGALPDGTRSITFIAADGTRQPVGKVTFVHDGDGARIEVKLDAPEFTDEFLSMRPFRCLSGPKQQWCHLPYGYDIKGRVTAADLMDLEYMLMFIWRTYERVGADAWNGLYFKLALAPDGSIAGDLHEADFNILAVPPDDPTVRPVTHRDLTPAQPGNHLFDRVEIR
ncbi:MAG: hypothetical protein ACT4N2_03475 [Hyphomicrobium sp.]